MSAPPSLPTALFRHAAAHAEEPWLFRAEGWDWRWHSWGEIAGRVKAEMASLADRAAGSRIAFPFEARPEAIVLDLAIQAAGHGVVLLRDGEAVELTAADLVAMAEGIEAQIAPSGSREIVVLSGPFEIPEERAMLSWATVNGAAVVLEPNPAYRVATAAWVRPTVFHGTSAELTSLRTWVEKEKKGWLHRGPRLPFRRLRTVLVAGPALAEEDEAFWRVRGVRVCRIAA
jgi:hypothetical protein